MVGDHGTIIHTSDGGARWSPQLSGTTNGLSSVTFVDASHGWAVGNYGTILRTSDAGKHWVRQRSGTTNPLSCVTFIDASHGWAVGSYAVLRTIDGGNHWTRLPSGAMSVTFVDRTHGWATTRLGTIAHTVDGGEKWSPQASGVAERLSRVEFISPGRGWAVGGRGTILRYTGPVDSSLATPRVAGKPTHTARTSIAGQLWPGRASAIHVTLERRERCVWRAYRTTTVASRKDGGWTWPIWLGAGTFRVKARVVSSVQYTAATSAWRTFEVR